MATPTDPLYAQQWHLPMLGNLERIWDEFTGNGVKVGVYDDGVQTNHPDLSANYNAALHFTYNGTTYLPTPLQSSHAHGTACAGLIGAVDNNGRGGVGVAHGVDLTGINFLRDLQYNYDFNTGQTSPLYDAVVRWAANFDIMSNSWGTAPFYQYYQNLNESGSFAQVTADHFEWVSANGRGGLGTVIVKAAGNDAMNANGDGLNAARHVITVAAVEQNGFVADYSNWGVSILVSGPAASVTTDLRGNQGYNVTGTEDEDPLPQTDYTSTFNGTSAATPVVAGVVALMLDANENLGWRDVQTILAMSAQHTGSAVGGPSSGFEIDAWQVMGGSHWNGGGNIFSESYGFGMVDAFAAVRMAEAWAQLYDGQTRTSANEMIVAQDALINPVNIGLSDGDFETSELEIDFVMTEDMEIDTIYVTLDMFHSYASDLRIFLQSPAGDLMALAYNEGGSNTINHVWTFGVTSFRGQSSVGEWTVVIHDDYAGDTGTVYDADLEFFGSAASANDVYHFTDDFAMMRTLEAARGTIGDADGGVDWLNFAAVTSNLNVNLAAGGAIRVAGVIRANLESGPVQFENIYTGDGNDTVTGNDLANEIWGGRGNDRILGNGGNDDLNGGAGNDVLLGGIGNDTIRGGDGNDTITSGSGRDTILGGAGEDLFIFAPAFGNERISGWEDNIDTLQLDDAIWGGGLTAAQVVSTYAAVVGGSVIFTFSRTNTISLFGFTDIASVADDIVIV